MTAGDPRPATPEGAGTSRSEPAGAPRVVDCRGQRCPLPVIALARALPSVPPGGVLRVLADDPAAATDIPAWCRLRGQEFLGTVVGPDGPGYEVRRVNG